MSTTYQVGYFVGSLSKNSINRTLSKALIRLAPDDLAYDSTAGFLRGYMRDFREHIARVLTVIPRPTA